MDFGASAALGEIISILRVDQFAMIVYLYSREFFMRGLEESDNCIRSNFSFLLFLVFPKFIFDLNDPVA